MKFFTYTKNQFHKLKFLIQTKAPVWVIFYAFALNLSHRFLNKFTLRGKGYVEKMNNFKLSKQKLKLDNDWFTDSIPTWLRAIECTDLKTKNKINCLEIGSWQGLSAFFILNELKNSDLVCVDTWEGADEHKDESMTTFRVLKDVEDTFDHNLKKFISRITKYKGTSSSYYEKNLSQNKFNLIYVDGSHHADDVIIDALRCFEMLCEGGLLIFDDYLWKYYDKDIDNPAGAINKFLKIKKHQVKILCFDYQLAIKKVSIK